MTTNIAVAITVTSCVCAFIVTCLMMFGTVVGGNLKQRIYIFFFLTLLFCAVGAISEGVSTMVITSPDLSYTALLQIADFLSYTFAILFAICFVLYVYEYLSLKRDIKKGPFIFMIFCFCADMALIVVAFISGFYSLQDYDNAIAPWNLLTISKIPYVIVSIVMIGVTLRNVKCLKKREWASIFMYSVMPMLCYVVEAIFVEYPLWITYFGTAIVLLLIYINIQVELKYALLEREAELAQSRIDIMMTQIQPHFIHNSLLAIQYLCNKDAKEAEKAVVDFSEYLRGNLHSLTNKEPIKFEQELEHLSLYLKLEQRRFEERLQVKYDIDTSDFKLPALTLQPIVENAVLHGITKKVEGGKITIRTREDLNFWHIIVEDTGMGFDTEQPLSDDKPHLGIQNVRYRLEALCDGTLEIKSAPRIGTTATILIPKGANKS